MNETTLSGKTPDIAEENIAKLREIFPDVFSENKVDFDKLRQVLGEYIEDADERYNFTWNGKSKALHLAQTPSTGTLRPCKEESKNWDTTQNLYIEGDNLEVLKLLQKSYHGKIKMIYIDPPYNTGHDFVYKDDYRDNIQNYLEVTGQLDGEGRKLGTNSESSGRYHTDWLNMMYPRLRLARNLLSDDGAIFISIDDYEQSNVRKLCDEIYGEDNFIACVVWQRNYAPISLKKFFSESHEYALIYCKNISKFQMNLLPRGNKQNKDYKNPDNDPRGAWKVGNLTVGPAVEKQIYEIVGPTGKRFMPPSGYCWRFTKEKFEEMRADNRIWFGSNGNNSPVPKLFLTEVQNGVTPMTLWTFEEAGHNQIATREVRDIFNGAVFSSPKPIKYIKRYLYIGMNKDDIILDFFSGSATTAHAVMQLNAEDGGNRRFICVQLPEATDKKSEAYKAGYKNICEIGKERIRRAGEKIIKNEELRMNNEKGKQMEIGDGADGSDNSSLSIIHSTLDTGFKVFKLDSSNIKKWNPDYDDIQQTLYDMVDNIVDGRTEIDLAYEIMLKYGLDLSYPVDELDCGGKKIYSVGFGMLMICMADDVTTDVAKFIADYKKEKDIDEMRVVFKDTCFKDDSTKTNIKEILKCAGVEEFVTV